MRQSQMFCCSAFECRKSLLTRHVLPPSRHKYETNNQMVLLILDTQKLQKSSPVDPLCLCRLGVLMVFGLKTVLQLCVHIASNKVSLFPMSRDLLSHFHCVQLWFLFFEEESWLQPKSWAPLPFSSKSCALHFCNTTGNTADGHQTQRM